MKKYLALAIILCLAAVFIACGDQPGGNSNTAATAGPADPNDTPTAAYKRLFAAVKSRDLEAIKTEFSQKSIAMAQTQAARANVQVEEVYKNGFTATTFSETLPEIRDERVKGDMGAVEVWNARDKMWEDLPFIREGSGWKLAVGDAFAGSWRRPGPGRSAREMEASNIASGSNGIINGSPNVNMNDKIRKLANANANSNKG
jgi:hypothetical protein